MKNKTTTNYFRKIKTFLREEEFGKIEKHLFLVHNVQLEAFWNLVSAGYPVEFAILNYINLYEYIKSKNISYYEALQVVYTIFPGLKAGIYIKEIEQYELN